MKPKRVRFDELTLDQAGQRAFYVDTDSLERDPRRQREGPSLTILENHAFDPLIEEAFPELAAHTRAQRGDFEEWEEAPF